MLEQSPEGPTIPERLPKPERPRQGFPAMIKILIVLLLTFIIGGGIWAYFYFKAIPEKETSQETEPATTEDETTNWKIYTNEVYGYSIKYPEDWKFEEKDVSSVKGEYYEKFRVWFESPPFEVTTGPEISQGPVIQIIVNIHDNPNNLDLDKWHDNYFKKWKKGVGFEIVSENKITIGEGIDSLEIILKRSVEYKSVLVRENNQIFRIELAYPAEGQDYSKDANKSFQQMLSTFQFTK